MHVNLPTIAYASETCKRTSQRSGTQANEMSYVKGSFLWCEYRTDDKSNESVCGRYDIYYSKGKESNFREMVKHSTLRWFSHLDRMADNEMTKIIYNK